MHVHKAIIRVRIRINRLVAKREFCFGAETAHGNPAETETAWAVISTWSSQQCTLQHAMKHDEGMSSKQNHNTTTKTAVTQCFQNRTRVKQSNSVLLDTSIGPPIPTPTQHSIIQDLKVMEIMSL
jgi:hypothetical protein